MTTAAGQSRTVTFVLCFLASMVEGYDLQAGSVVLRKLIGVFHLSPAQTTWVPTSNTLGLLIGAVVGGWLADRIGRKWVLTCSMILFGVFSIGTAYAWNAPSLLAMRFLVGLGLGGAMPNIIALLAESSATSGQTSVGMISRVTAQAAAIPFGGFASTILALSLGPTFDWKTIFLVGGYAPVVVGLLMIPLLQESPVFLQHSQARTTNTTTRTVSTGEALFGGGRALPTLLLWISFLSTLIVLYLLLNWLPLLMTGRGLSPIQATWVASMFSIGGAVGAMLLGLLMRLGHRLIVTIIYGCMALGIYALSSGSNDFDIALASAFVVGLFVIGGQYVLYGLAPTYYPGAVRGTGVGWAVSIGRIGAVLGPYFAGRLLEGGRDSSQVIIAIMPAVLVAFIAAFWLVTKEKVADAEVAAALRSTS